MNLIEKYLGEATKIMPTRSPDKLEQLLKNNKIKYKATKKGIEVEEKDYDKVEKLMAKNLIF